MKLTKADDEFALCSAKRIADRKKKGLMFFTRKNKHEKDQSIYSVPENAGILKKKIGGGGE